MKFFYVLLFLLSVTVRPASAQVNTNIAGVYTLTGVRETASGFNLKKDFTFEFYYSYGAVDRYGAGKWRLDNNRIIMDSKIIHTNDFKITDSAAASDNVTSIKIGNTDPTFNQFIYCRIKMAKGDTLLSAENDGIIKLPFETDSITLLFELCPEKSSRLGISRSAYKVYTIQFEPWIAEVFFKNYKLKYTQGHLEGRHPLLDEKELLLRKKMTIKAKSRVNDIMLRRRLYK